MSLKAELRKLLKPFRSGKYWEQRYMEGGDSGAGSFGKLAAYKSDYINNLVREFSIESVVEWGCGNGQQLKSFNISDYTGIDISPTAIAQCQEQFAQDADKRFLELKQAGDVEAELSMSLDVLYHLIEDKAYHKHLKQVFDSAQKYVLIYSCDLEGGSYGVHVKPRKFTRDVERGFPAWRLMRHEVNPFPLDELGPKEGSWSDFYLFGLKDST